MNLSYCRIHNTVNDMRDCVSGIEDGRQIMETEIDAAMELRELSKKFLELTSPKLTARSEYGDVIVIDCDSRTESHYQQESSVVTLLRGVIESLVEALDRANSLYPMPMNLVTATVENARNTLAAMDRT